MVSDRASVQSARAEKSPNCIDLDTANMGNYSAYMCVYMMRTVPTSRVLLNIL